MEKPPCRTLLAAVLMLIAAPERSQPQAQGPAFTRAWTGQVNVGGVWYSGSLYKIESRPGVRPSGIRESLALAIFAPQPSRAVLIVITGGRNGSPSSSFSSPDSAAHAVLNVKEQLDRGTHIVFAEYRGSTTPGGAPSSASRVTDPMFRPPFPRYNDLIAGYESYEGSEWGHGEVEDVVSVVRFVQSEGVRLNLVDPARISVAGHSHGGYLALEAARRVAGIARTVVRDGPTDVRAMAQWYRDAPTVAWLHLPSKNPRQHLEEITAGHANMELEEGRRWPSNREAFVQRVFRQAGGEEEFLGNRPGCSPYASPPLSRNILFLTNLDDPVVPTTQSRHYWRRFNRRGDIPEIQLVEFATGDLYSPFDPAVFHGGPQEEPIIAQYLADGTTPSRFTGPVAAGLHVKVVEADIGAPIAGALVRLQERFSACSQPSEWMMTTDVNGTAFLDQSRGLPAGFLYATVSAPGFTERMEPLYLARGENDRRATPFRLDRTAPATVDSTIVPNRRESPPEEDDEPDHGLPLTLPPPPPPPPRPSVVQSHNERVEPETEETWHHRSLTVAGRQSNVKPRRHKKIPTDSSQPDVNARVRDRSDIDGGAVGGIDPRLRALPDAGPSRDVRPEFMNICRSGNSGVSMADCVSIVRYLGDYDLWGACFLADRYEKCALLCSNQPRLGCAPLDYFKACLQAKQSEQRCRQLCQGRADCGTATEPAACVVTSCNAPAPSCGKPSTGIDNCGNPCGRSAECGGCRCTVDGRSGNCSGWFYPNSHDAGTCRDGESSFTAPAGESGCNAVTAHCLTAGTPWANCGTYLTLHPVCVAVEPAAR